MPTSQPASWTADPRARRVRARLSIAFMLIGLAAAAGTRFAYQRMIQAPACYDYGRLKNLPELEHLRFTSARIASKQRVHTCYFRHEQRGTPVALQFDRADIPNLRDGVEIAAIIAAFVISVLLGRWQWRRWLNRNGYA
jgi:hypothetical protein